MIERHIRTSQERRSSLFNFIVFRTYNHDAASSPSKPVTEHVQCPRYMLLVNDRPLLSIMKRRLGQKFLQHAATYIHPHLVPRMHVHHDSISLICMAIWRWSTIYPTTPLGDRWFTNNIKQITAFHALSSGLRSGPFGVVAGVCRFLQNCENANRELPKLQC